MARMPKLGQFKFIAINTKMRENLCMADLCLLPVAFFPFVTQIGKFVSRESCTRGNYRKHTYHDIQPT